MNKKYLITTVFLLFAYLYLHKLRIINLVSLGLNGRVVKAVIVHIINTITIIHIIMMERKKETWRLK